MTGTIQQYDKQIEFNGKAYVDPKRMPVETHEELLQIPENEVFEGMKVTVLSDDTVCGELTRYIYSNGKWILCTPVCEIILPKCVTFTAVENNSRIGLSRISTNQMLEYSIDLNTWANMDTATTITLTNSGDSVYIRGMLSGDNTGENYTQFKMTGKIAASGNCNYLWNYTNPDAPLKQFCGVGMFWDCTSLTTAPALPATTLADYCYYGMFNSCTSLTTAPELPATMLTVYCYEYMFYGCSNLNYIKCLATDISATNCTSFWVYGVSNSGTFVKIPSMSDWTISESGIPTGWAVEDAEE